MSEITDFTGFYRHFKRSRIQQRKSPKSTATAVFFPAPTKSLSISAPQQKSNHHEGHDTTKLTHDEFTKLYRLFLLQFPRESLSSVPAALINHDCTSSCPTWQYRYLHICKSSGNVHECTWPKCNRTLATSDSYVCDLTGVVKGNKIVNFCGDDSGVADDYDGEGYNEDRECEFEIEVKEQVETVEGEEIINAADNDYEDYVVHMVSELKKEKQKVNERTRRHSISIDVQLIALSGNKRRRSISLHIEATAPIPSPRSRCPLKKAASYTTISKSSSRKLKQNKQMDLSQRIQMQQEVNHILSKVSDSCRKKEKFALTKEQKDQIADHVLDSWNRVRTAPGFVSNEVVYKFEYHALVVLYEMICGYIHKGHKILPPLAYLRELPERRVVCAKHPKWKSKHMTRAVSTFRMLVDQSLLAAQKK